MKYIMMIVSGFLIGIVACTKESAQESIPVKNPDDCLVKASKINGQIIEDEYIITFKKDTTHELLTLRSADAVGRLLARVSNEDLDFDILAMGETPCIVAHRMDEIEAARLKNDPSVLSIEPDRKVAIASCVDVIAPHSVTWSVRKTGYGRAGLVGDKTAWVIDTGIDYDHPDLNVDVGRCRSFISGQTTADDLNGHGTHVAGIIGAKNNQLGILGIASDIRLVALKVLDHMGEGRLSGVIAAVRHISNNAKAGDVVNMSLGSEGVSITLEREVTIAAEKGILFAIAAGNDYKNAANYSPARVNHRNVLTVSAVDSLHRFASFSNFGPDVDVAAYGVKITSTYKDGKYAILSGTSMAAPHVAGLMLVRGINIPRRGVALNDPDGVPDQIARE
jgi:subtilisin family serine protease